MTLTRWKLMAGVLGISIVGVVAMAGPQCPNTKKDTARETAPPSRAVDVPTKVSKFVDVKVESPARTELSVPLPTPTVQPVALPVVSVELPTLVSPKLELPKLSPVRAEPFVAALPPTPEAAPKFDAVKLDLPKADPAPPVLTPKVELTPSKPDRVVELPLPGVTAAKPTAPVVDLPETKSAAPPTITFSEPAVATPTPALTPKKVEPVAEKPARTPTEESAVRIVIHLGTGQPKFDGMSGDDALLKAVCNNIDIRSPNSNGAGITPLKAGGKVRFSAPGCEGTCDNLTVLPSTGEVELTGNVQVQCRMGKGRTEINATTMRFKLGSAPAYSVSEPSSGTVTPAAGRETP